MPCVRPQTRGNVVRNIEKKQVVIWVHSRLTSAFYGLRFSRYA